MKVLIGTTNPSKVKRFERLLGEYDVEFCTLKDLGISDEPLETGNTPEENAVIKAKFYGKYFDAVICNDSGLYFKGMPLNDERQPGLNIRTPKGSNRLDDEQMIAYYAKLIHSLGGKITAYYLDGIAVYKEGKIDSFMETEDLKVIETFYMVDSPSEIRHEGWPLDSLSVSMDTNKYFVDKITDKTEVKGNVFVSEYGKKVTEFLRRALEL